MSAEIFLKGNHFSKETLKQFLNAMDIKYDSNVNQKKYYIDLYNNAITNENNRMKLHNTNYNIINKYKCSNNNTNHKRHSTPIVNDFNSVKDKQSSLKQQRRVPSIILKTGVLGIGGYMLNKPILSSVLNNINNNIYPEMKSKVIELLKDYITINKKLFKLAMNQINEIVTYVLDTYTNEEIIVLFFILILLLVLSYYVTKKIYLHYT